MFYQLGVCIFILKSNRKLHRLENYHLTVTLVKEEDGGDYEVRAENEFGSVSSKSTVTIHSEYSFGKLERRGLKINFNTYYFENKEATIAQQITDDDFLEQLMILYELYRLSISAQLVF